jgi:hypothetical protein
MIPNEASWLVSSSSPRAGYILIHEQQLAATNSLASYSSGLPSLDRATHNQLIMNQLAII